MSRITIGGDGFGSALVACCLAACDPHVHIELRLETGEILQGLEPIVLDCVPARFRTAIEPLIVREWPAFTIIGQAGQSTHSAEIALLDPRQLALELDLLRGRISVRRTDPGSADLDLVIDAAAGRLVSSSEIVDSTSAGLALPVLADFEVARDKGLFLEYFPLVGETVLVRNVAISPDFDPISGLAADDGAALAAAILTCSASANRAINQALEFIGLG